MKQRSLLQNSSHKSSQEQLVKVNLLILSAELNLRMTPSFKLNGSTMKKKLTLDTDLHLSLDMLLWTFFTLILRMRENMSAKLSMNLEKILPRLSLNVKRCQQSNLKTRFLKE